jgi:ribokinase
MQGANTCVMAARLGAQSILVGKVGEDEHGAAYLAHLAAEGVTTKYTRAVPATTTGIATILLESASGENQIVIVPGANAALGPADVAAAAADSAVISNCRVVATVLEVGRDAVAAALRLGRSIGARTVLNAAPAPAAGLEPAILEATDVLVVNETEAEVLAGCGEDEVGGWAAAADRLLKLGCRSVVITLGAAGAVVAEADRPGLVALPAPKVGPPSLLTGQPVCWFFADTHGH